MNPENQNPVPQQPNNINNNRQVITPQTPQYGAEGLTPANIQPQVGVSDNPKAKPPVAAQILYALGFLGLIGGLLNSVVMFASSSSDTVTSLISVIGISSLDLQIRAVIAGLIVIGLFTLINFIRAQKLWALIAYTALIATGFMGTLLEVLTRSEIEKLMNRGNPVAEFATYIIVVPLLVVLWTKNRKSFS